MTLPFDPVKNALLLSLSIAIVRVRHLNEGMSKYKNNIIVNGLGMQNKLKIWQANAIK